MGQTRVKLPLLKPRTEPSPNAETISHVWNEDWLLLRVYILLVGDERYSQLVVCIGLAIGYVIS
jgi:hypothetical protein